MVDSLRKQFLIGIFLSVLVLVSYWGVAGNDFINYDDPAYVTANRHVQRGLSGEAVVWALTASYASNWHPLTWLSLMLDHDLFGMNAAGYHWTNVILHGFAGLVLFFALGQMTGRLWCSGLVAGLFLVHPLHVESVAWVAERKDVLSGLFWMLGLWGYARYAQKPSVVRYGWVVLFFLLGLMSKPMVVTFPFVLLLLDYWPLRRAVDGRRSWGHLVYEKIPLFFLSAAVSIITFLVQKEGGAAASLQDLPLANRLANAVVSYSHYLVKTVWPFTLAVFYPHPGSWPVSEVILSLLLIFLITLLVLLLIRHRQYLIMGWLWYLGTLFPVIGLVQVGAQAMADRYTYLPLIGVYIMVVWGFRDLLQGRPTRRVIGGAVSGGVLAVLVVMTQIQVGYWRDSITLFTHALRVTDGNYQANNNLGNALISKGRYKDAVGHYHEAIRILPAYAVAYNNLGIALMSQGNLEEAMTSNAKALEIKPGDGDAHFNRGEIFFRRGEIEEAIAQYRIALKKKPYDPQLHNNLGVALTNRGKLSEAIGEYREAIRLDLEHSGAHNNLAMILAGRGEIEEAIDHFRKAVQYQPEYANAHYQLAQLLSRKGLADDAAYHIREAYRINPAIVDRKGGDAYGQYVQPDDIVAR